MSEHHNQQHPDAAEPHQPNTEGSQPSAPETSGATARRERENNPDTAPRIWVGSLADYTAGRLHGDWFDAAVDPAELRTAIDTMLGRSREPDAEEWAIFDYDNFGCYRVEEYDQIDEMSPPLLAASPSTVLNSPPGRDPRRRSRHAGAIRRLLPRHIRQSN